jgi:uncharacterized RDD family membrane protein YckC
MHMGIRLTLEVTGCRFPLPGIHCTNIEGNEVSTLPEQIRTYIHARNCEKAPTMLRVTAAIIDGTIAGLPWLLITPLWGFSPYNLPAQSSLLQGCLIGLALLWTFYYSCFRDCMGNGQSIGKRMLGLMVIGLESNLPCTTMQSFLRNVIFVLDFGLIAEILLTLSNVKTGRRFGDFIAQTQVVEITRYYRRHLR